jgi:hypothetical protein
MTTTSHTNCTHPATKAGRAACRKARAQGTAPAPTVKIAKAQAETALAPRLIKSIMFETMTCGRCAGTGQFPSAMWQGVCLGCSGVGIVRTRNGKAAARKYEAYLAAHHTITAIDLKAGDKIRKMGRWVTVHDVDTDYARYSANGFCTIGTGDNAYSFCSINISYVTKTKTESVLNFVAPYADVIVRPQGDAQQAAFRAVANLKGTIVEYAD